MVGFPNGLYQVAETANALKRHSTTVWSNSFCNGEQPLIEDYAAKNILFIVGDIGGPLQEDPYVRGGVVKLGRFSTNGEPGRQVSPYPAAW